MTRPYSLNSSLTTNYSNEGGYTDVVYGPLVIGVGCFLTIGLNGFVVVF